MKTLGLQNELFEAYTLGRETYSGYYTHLTQVSYMPVFNIVMAHT